MSTQRLVGIMLLAAGAILFIIGINASDSIPDRLSNFVTGHFTDATVWYLIGGVASVIGGLALTTFRGRGLLA